MKNFNIFQIPSLTWVRGDIFIFKFSLLFFTIFSIELADLMELTDLVRMKYEAGVLSFSCEIDLFIQWHLDTGWEQLMKTGFNDLVFSSTFFWFIGLIFTLLVLGSPLGYCLLVLGVFWLGVCECEINLGSVSGGNVVLL